jgi:hypothetical protein
VQTPFRGDGEAPRLGHRDEIAEMPQFQLRLPYLPGMEGNLQSLFPGGNDYLDLWGRQRPIVGRERNRDTDEVCLLLLATQF